MAPMDLDFMMRYQQIAEMELEDLCQEQGVTTEDEVRELADQLSVIGLTEYEIESILRKVEKNR